MPIFQMREKLRVFGKHLYHELVCTAERSDIIKVVVYWYIPGFILRHTEKSKVASE